MSENCSMYCFVLNHLSCNQSWLFAPHSLWGPTQHIILYLLWLLIAYLHFVKVLWVLQVFWTPNSLVLTLHVRPAQCGIPKAASCVIFLSIYSSIYQWFLYFWYFFPFISSDLPQWHHWNETNHKLWGKRFTNSGKKKKHVSSIQHSQTREKNGIINFWSTLYVTKTIFSPPSPSLTGLPLALPFFFLHFFIPSVFLSGD